MGVVVLFVCLFWCYCTFGEKTCLLCRLPIQKIGNKEEDKVGGACKWAGREWQSEENVAGGFLQKSDGHEGGPLVDSR